MKFLEGIVARIIYAIPFLMFGFGHFGHAQQMAGMVPIPGGAVWVYVTGACMLLAGLAIITGIKGELACLLLALLLFIYIFSIHMPGLHAADANMKMMSFANILKDTGLAGGALAIAGVFRAKRM